MRTVNWFFPGMEAIVMFHVPSPLHKYCLSDTFVMHFIETRPAEEVELVSAVVSPFPEEKDTKLQQIT